MEEKGKQALYRRYRSTSFDELVGQEHVTELLKAAVKNGTFSHAYLFTGQRGTGKTSAARLLAYAINDLPYEVGASHLDVIEIDAASNRRIDDIRDLREKVHIAPVSAKYKVYIIDEVHMLTGESFNALLKTLEEPPEHTVFILATTELHKVPATIVSRVQRFHFRPVALDKVVEHLKTIAAKEKIDIDDEALKLIAEHGGGSFRDSISLLDQVGSLSGKITAEIVENILGRARSTEVAQVVSLLQQNDSETLHDLLRTMLANGTSPVTLTEQIVAALLNSPQPDTRWYELAEKLMGVSRAHFPGLLMTSLLMGFVSPKAKPHIEDLGSQILDLGKSQEVKSVKAEDLGKSQKKESGEEDLGSQFLDLGKSQKDSHQNLEPRTQNHSETKGELDWEKVLEAVKKTNPALHSVLSRATANFADNTLTLSFRYALHGKKLDQTQYRTQLSRCVQDTCNINPNIVVETGQTVAAVDPSAKKVADLMGGGESVVV